MISESISFYIRLFSLPLFLYFLILLNLSLRRSACLHVSNITSVFLISLSLCTSLLFHPFPLLSVTRLSFLSRSLISSHSSLIYRSVFCMSLTSLTAFPPPFPSIHFFFFYFTHYCRILLKCVPTTCFFSLRVFLMYLSLFTRDPSTLTRQTHLTP